ncbi:histidine kinase [Zobellia laminariae]|uniref:histidine kinase n=1 Tax=Zobellia laminariae TaxID=248906 RepID=UPI0026F44824|nr:histidine kinase [Zobellia laminariae]WKX74604.1 histidine kinase [Zobellia laminariae]
MFWTLQCIGWGSLLVFAIAIDEDETSLISIVKVTVLVFIVGIFSSGLYRWFLKKYTNNKITFRNILKICAFGLLSAIIWTLLSSGIGSLYKRNSSDYEHKQEPVTEEKAGVFVKAESDEFEIQIGGEAAILIFGITLFVIWSILYFIIKSLIRNNLNRIERLRLREKIKGEQLNTLQGHVSSVFIVQVLNRIKALMAIDVKRSRSLLTELSELLRYSLTKQNVQVIPLIEEIEATKKYIELYQIEFPESLNFSCKDELELSELEVPPMLLLNIVEFFLGNNLPERSFSATMVLDIVKVDGALKISVQVNGEGIDITENDFVKKKMNQRLILLFNNSSKLSVDTLQKKIEVEIPSESIKLEVL